MPVWLHIQLKRRIGRSRISRVATRARISGYSLLNSGKLYNDSRFCKNKEDVHGARSAMP